MRTKPLLIATAIIEFGAGLALLAVPSFVVLLLLGTSLDDPAALIVGRLAGGALLALALINWAARHDQPSRAVSGIVRGMLFYNAVAVILFIFAWIRLPKGGIGLWPATLLHAVMTIWCFVCFRSSQR